MQELVAREMPVKFSNYPVKCPWNASFSISRAREISLKNPWKKKDPDEA